ncbi:MAG: uracil-DNA glycosylase [Ignavibacteriae bacterium]|nr:MAG: uracil-DNA glycosylase [Ignavibacteriota bacterium]
MVTKVQKDKQNKLDEIAKEIAHCKICKAGKSGLPVPGEGNPDANIVFLGEAPGKNEAKTGRPFIGRSGKYLRELIKSVGIKDEDFYITSPVKYLPDRGTPTPEDIKHGKTHLDKQLKIIDPVLIVLLGSVAAKAVLAENYPVMQHHGKIVEQDNRKYFLTIHPAAVLRFQKNRAVIEEDFKKLKKLIDKTTLF